MTLTIDHGLVEPRAPIEPGNSLELRIRRPPIDRLHGRSMPRIHIPRRDDDFRIRVGLYQLLREGYGGPIAHRLAVAQQLVPLLAAELADSVELGGEGVLPHQAVRRVLDGRRHHVVAVVEAELFEGGAEGGGARATKAEGEHAHGDHTPAFPTVDVGVCCEDVRDRLGGVGEVCVGHGGRL